MKKLYGIKAYILIYFLMGFITTKAQENRHALSTEVGYSQTTWNGTTWDNGKPNQKTKAIFSDDYIAKESITALEIEVLPKVTVIITENAILKVINDIKVDKTAKLILDENAQLVQKNPNATTSSVTLKRKTRKIDKFDYTYFCSPVEGQILNQIGDSFYFTFYDNSDPILGYQSPLFDKYAFFNQNLVPHPFYANNFNSGNWQSVPETSTMDPAGQAGIGFIVRGPQSFAAGNKQNWFVKFDGVPHNVPKNEP